jgi:hypothetical protein
LSSGATYKFKVKALNIAGPSIFSSELTIIAVAVPDPPTALTETVASKTFA